MYLPQLVLEYPATAAASTIANLIIYTFYAETMQHLTIPFNTQCHNFFDELYVCMQNSNTIDPELSSRAISVEYDSEVNTTECFNNRQWNQNYLSTSLHTNRQNGKYTYSIPDTQTNLPVYILDTHIDVTHPEFENRASIGATFSDTSIDNGHGTHVAGIVAGKSYGVNPYTKVIGVTVLNRQGSGQWSTIIQGLQWVSQQSTPAIINMSISGGLSSAMDKIINLLKTRGWQIVVAAGNKNDQACKYSPANSPDAITVAASTSTDKFASFSNHGRCVDIIAPGENILSAFPSRRLSYMSGTSMAAPHIAGILSFGITSHSLLTTSVKFLISNTPSETENLFPNMNTLPLCYDSWHALVPGYYF